MFSGHRHAVASLALAMLGASSCGRAPREVARDGELPHHVIVDAGCPRPTRCRLGESGAAGADDARCEWRKESDGSRTLVLERVNDLGQSFGTAIWLTLGPRAAQRIPVRVSTVDMGVPDLGAPMRGVQQHARWSGRVVASSARLFDAGEPVWGSFSIDLDASQGSRWLSGEFSIVTW